jgi:phospholipase C
MLACEYGACLHSGVIMPSILRQIQHIVLVMLENRSFDNMCGWLYGGEQGQPKVFLPPSPAAGRDQYEGLSAKLFNPIDAHYFQGKSKEILPIFPRANATDMPNPDPKEDYGNVNYQLFGPEAPNKNPTWGNLGFVINYQTATGANSPVQIMEPFSVEQVPIISALAKSYAVCDRWFCSVPTETWPNRSFVHAGTSNGNVINGNPPNPFDWDVDTIFNVLEACGYSWKVYCDTALVPSLTFAMFPKLWPYALNRFAHFDDFKEDCRKGALPRYTFLEPSFIENPNDEHPPHDVLAGEQFLRDIWAAVSTSPKWNETLLLITYDEHGGTYDHVMPAWGAVPPDMKSSPGQQGFGFDRFGVRVPMVAVSPWIQEGAVFRSNSPVPFDHASIPATLRDWLGIPDSKMLPSLRVRSAPTLGHVLTLTTPRDALPAIPEVPAEAKQTATFLPANSLQRSLVSADAVRKGNNPHAVLSNIVTKKDALDYFARPHSSGNVTRPKA